MVKHLPHISIEKYAAYLDDNLPDEEMKQMKAFIDNDADMQAVLEADSNIGDDLDLDLLENEPIPFDMELPSIELPSLDLYSPIEQSGFIDEIFSPDDDRYGEEMVSIINETDQDNYSQNNIIMANTEYRTYGENGENVYDPIFIKQPDDHSCGLRSQQIVLRDFGIDIPFEDLERYALDAGVYSEDGTYTYDIGKVVEMAGVGMHQVQGSTIYDLTNELAQGHRVIVSVDAHELWYNKTPIQKLNNWMNDVIGPQGGNHALIVAGVEVNPSDPKDVKVVLTDPGAGHLRIEYPLDQFMDAWKDSNCFMAATDCPAPYQYNASTATEEPSNFYVEHSYNNQFVVDHGYQLQSDMINVQSDYQPQYVGVSSYDDLLDQMEIMGDSESAGGVGNLLNENVQDDAHLFHHEGDMGDLSAFDHPGDFVYHSVEGESAGSVGLENTTPLQEDHFHEDTSMGEEE